MASGAIGYTSCRVCGKTTTPAQCRICKLQGYCGREHRAADRARHKPACDEARKSLVELDGLESGSLETYGKRDRQSQCRRIWRELIQRLLSIDTLAADNLASRYVMPLHHLHGDCPYLLIDFAPMLELRRGNEQRCYGYLKWLAVNSYNISLRWEAIRGRITPSHGRITRTPTTYSQDAFESLDPFRSRYAGCYRSHKMVLILLKYRLLLGVTALQVYSDTGSDDKLPQEFHDHVRGYLVCDAVRNNQAVMDSKDQSMVIEQLGTQLRDLLESVGGVSSPECRVLVAPRGSIEAALQAPVPKPPTHPEVPTLISLKHTYEAWVQTPGAIDFIRGMLSGNTPTPVVPEGSMFGKWEFGWPWSPDSPPPKRRRVE